MKDERNLVLHPVIHFPDLPDQGRVMRGVFTIVMVGGLFVAASGLGAQSLAQRVSAVRTGTVRFEYAAGESRSRNLPTTMWPRTRSSPAASPRA